MMYFCKRRILVGIVALTMTSGHLVAQDSLSITTAFYHNDPWALLEDVFVIKPRLKRERFVQLLKIFAGTGAGVAVGIGAAHLPYRLSTTYSRAEGGFMGFFKVLMNFGLPVAGGMFGYALTSEMLDHALDAEAYVHFIQRWQTYRTIMPADYRSLFDASYECYQQEGADALEGEVEAHVHMIRYAVYRRYSDRYARFLKEPEQKGWKKYFVVDIGNILKGFADIFRATQQR